MSEESDWFDRVRNAGGGGWDKVADPNEYIASMRGHEVSAEQQARDLLESMGVPDAQGKTAGDLVGLANLIAQLAALTLERDAARSAEKVQTERVAEFRRQRDEAIAERDRLRLVEHVLSAGGGKLTLHVRPMGVRWIARINEHQAVESTMARAVATVCVMAAESA